MYKIQIKIGEKRVQYKPLSTVIKYITDDKNIGNSIKNIEKLFNIKLSELQRSNLLSKEIDYIRISKYDGKPDDVILFKVNLKENFSSNYFRNHIAGVIQKLKKEEIKQLHIFVPSFDLFKNYFENKEHYLQSFIEGLYLGNYSFENYKSEKTETKELTVNFYGVEEYDFEKIIKASKSVMEGVKITRDLENEPSSFMTPDLFIEKMQKIFYDNPDVNLKVYDEKELKKKGMGGILSVGRGSQNSPKFLVIEYLPVKSKKKLPKIALVGKGITFDSGGISIKPAAGMDEMKADMSGAAVVAGVILSASRLGIPLNLLGALPLAENMPSGASYKPGDIVKTASGKTIEVENTDAEGRIILADALEFVSKQKPEVIIDLATLTGACVVALGELAAGLFTKDDKLADKLYKSGIKTNDRLWRLPLWDDYNYFNKSEIADVKNLGGKWGGAITAAKFLENFVGKEIPWAHIDIAGPSFPHHENNYTKTYMTGYGVRLLIDYLQKY